MLRRRFVVFDLDFDVMERFFDRESAVRFARWLARGRTEALSVLVADDHLRGEIVWPESEWLRMGRAVY